MLKSISLDLLTVIEHESRNFIWNNKNYLYLCGEDLKDFKCLVQ